MAGYLGQSQPVAAGNNSVETVDIVDGAVTDDKIADGSITSIKMASVEDWGLITGSLDNAALDFGSVT